MTVDTHSFRPRWLIPVFLLCVPSLCAAGNPEEIPCIVFSGNSPKEHNFDLSKYNRIYLNESSFSVTSSSPDAETVELLYDLVHHIEFKHAIPSFSMIADVSADAGSSLQYHDDSRSLVVRSDEDSEFTVGVFGVSGQLMASAKVRTDEAFRLESLMPGIYVAVATYGKTKLTLKFILS